MKIAKSLLLAIGLMAMPATAMAQAGAAPAPVAAQAAPAETVAADDAGAKTAPAAATPAAEAAPAAAAPIVAPTPGVGMPAPGEVDFQDQYSPNGKYAKWLNNSILLPVITAISILVLFLLLWIIVRYNRRANPVASGTSHNTLIEVIWTLVPVLILVVIAVPSIGLIAKQYKPAPADAVTIKVTGYQWYWGYSYPDHGGFEVVSNMLKEKADVAAGERARTDADGPRLLAVDNRMVVPYGVPLRIQTTGADVIHSFAVPSLWFKIDTVPGRLNERTLLIEKPGVYFGQCSELCGARHAFMPISIQAVSPAEFAAWVKSQGGEMPGAAAPAAAVTPAAAAAPAAEAAPAAAPAAEAAPANNAI